MPDNIDKLFEIMQAKGAASDRGKFRKVFLTPGNKGYKIRKDIYDGLRADGIIDSPTYEDFRRKLRLGGTPTVNKYRQQMFNSVDPNKSRASELTHRAVGQAVRATNNVRKPVTAKVLNRKGKPTGNEFAITPAKTVEDLDREYAQETTKNWENELHDQMADADRDAAKISDMFKSFIGSTDEVGSVWGNMTRGGGIAGTPHSVTTNNGIMENTEARQILAAGDYNRKRRELLQLEQDSRNGAIFDDHSFWRGMYDAAKDTGFLTGGASDLINAGSLLATKQNLDNGVHTEAGDMLMQQAVKNSDAQSQYGDNQGWMYTGGVITTNMAPIMVQIGSAGFSKGMSNAIGKVVQGAASKVALGTMEKATGIAGAHIANYIGKVTGLTTKAFGKAIQYGIVGAAQANTVGLGNVANDVINRYTGQVYQDEQGNYKFGTFDSDGKLVHEGGEDFLTALVKGEAAQTIEFATELAGGGIDAAGTALKNFVTKGGKKIINKYNMENVSKVIDFLLNNKVSKNARYLKACADRTLGKVEVNSIVGESLEEELGIIANTVFTGDNKISDLWDEKQQSQIWGGMLLSIGLMKGAVAPFHAYNAKQYYSYKHKLDKADVNLSQLLGKEKWEELRNQIDATTNEDMPEMVNKINRDVALGKNRQPVREYIQNLLIMRGYDIGNMLAAKKAVEDKGEGVSVKNMEKNQAYQQGRDAYGYDTHEIQLDQEDKQKSLAQLLGISEQQLASMSNEELEALSGRDDNIDRAIYDYQLSTARYEGVIDNARDQIDLEVQRAAQAVDMYTDKSRNTIRNATIKATGGLEDYGVYIINGNIATHEDGSIDISNSDDMILYYDPTTNTVEHADAMMFAELGSEENADEVRSQAMVDAKEKAIKETTGIIDGVVEVGTQFKTVDADGTEHTYEVLADNGDGTAMITIDGNIPTELVKGENVNIPVSFEELQKMKDESDQQKLQAAKAQREQMEKERAEQQNQETEETQPSFDFKKILNDNGNVVPADVLDEDGNTRYPNSKLFLIRDSGAKAKVVELKSDGTLKSHAVDKKDVRTATTMTLDEYKQAMPESSMIEDNSGTIDANRGSIEVEDNTQPLSETDADNVIAQMESSAETVPDLELTPDNWAAEFGEDGILSTPIGDVKMGENQVAKLFEKGRSKEFGMIKPTLTNPDVIIEVPSHSTDGNEERSSSYLFIKTFLGKNGKKVYYFKSVTIRKDGLEISISSHYDRAKRVKEALMKGKLLYRKNDGAQTEQNQPSASVTTSQEDAAGSSESKDTNISSNGNENNESLTFEDGTPIPVDVNGEVDLSQTDASHAAEWYDNNLGEDADDWLDGEIKKAKKVLEQAKNKKLTGSKPSELVASKKEKEAAIADAQAHYDSVISIRDSLKERRIAKEENTSEGRKELIEKARRKFARLKSAVKDDAEAVSQLYRDTIGSLLHRLYDGTGIDVTDTIPLTAEEYVASNLGAHSLNYEGTETSKGVKQETGLSREDFVKTQLLAADGKGTTIDALVHSLWENRPPNLESLDTQDIRNALIGVLNSGFKASEARNFVENIRIAQAESILEEQKRAQENAAYAEQHKAEPEAELEAKSDEKAELKAKSEAKLDNESDNKSNDLSNETDNEKINDNINDNINAPEVPEDATDENPLGLQLSEDKVPFEIEGGKSGETYDINDNEDRQRLINDNKVDDKDILDIDMPKHVHKAIKELCKKMGLKVQFLYMGARSNGWIENGTMYLALDTEKATQFVFGHEMTHAIKQKNHEAYKELVKVAMAVTTKKKFEEDLAKVFQNYHGISGYNNVDDYVEEVVADNVGKFINDFDLAQKFSLRLNHPVLATILHAIQKIKSLLYGDFYKSVDALERIVEKAYVDTAKGEVTNSETGEDVSFSLRQKPEPKKKGIGYKVFVLKDGKLYPPMVANPDGAATPVGVWLDADAAPIAGESKTGRPQVKQGGKGTQGGSGKLAYRPGWHLGVVPYAIQFNRKDAEGNKTLFPKNFVFAEVEYAADVDYQEEARQEGINPSGKYQHSLAGLKHLPTDGYYMYRTNPNPETDPWVITGAMKVNRILTRAEQAELVKNAGREPQQIQEGDIVTDDIVNSINQEIADAPKFSLKVYHGSGADFTEFDFDHMGEGAGSQVFGWGGYVTSSKKIGKDYASIKYDPDKDVEYVGKNKKTFTDLIATLFDGGIRDYNYVKNILLEISDNDKSNISKKEEYDWFVSTKPEDWFNPNPTTNRNLYEVNIPEDNGSNYLEWEKTLTEKQINAIRDALAKNGVDISSFEKRGFKLDLPFKYVYTTVLPMMMHSKPKDVSKFLSSLGFTGIKYPAGTIMGGAEEGDTNYVIFKPEDMRITEHTKFSLKSKPVRFEAGKKLSDEEKKEVLSTLKDAYKVNGVSYHIEETAGGKEKRVYEPTADSYVVSDITNRPLRYYITLPDGRLAHPTEVYPNISDNEVKSSATKQGLLDEEVDQIVSAAIGNMKDIADNAKAIEVLTELQNLPHETHDVGYGMNNAQSYNYKTGIFTSDAAQAIDYVVRRMRRKEDVPTEIPAALKKAVADSYGMVDNLIDGMSSTNFSLKDNQGNPLNQDGTLKLDKIKSVDELTDEDFTSAFRNVELPAIPKNVDAAIGANGKPVIIKKNIFEKNWNAHKFTPAESKKVLNDALYNTDLVGHTQPTKKPNHWVAIKLDDKSPITVLEVNDNKNNVEVVGWYTLDERNLGRIKRQAERNGGELIMLTPKDDKVESLSTPPLSSAAKIDNSSETTKENGEKFSLKDEKTLAGVHNISEEKLLKAIKQGGLANPSVAVIDSSKQKHEGYGDISLILPSDKVAKRTGKNAGTWQGDAYTPTYPQVEKQISNKGSVQVNKDVLSVQKEMQHEVRSGIDRWILDGNDSNSGLKYLFLHEKGVAPEPKKIQPKFSDEAYNELKFITAGDFNIYGIGKADAQKVLDMYIEAKFDGDKDLYEEKTKAWLERNKSIVDAGAKGGMRYAIAKENVELYDEYGFNYKGVQTFVRDVEYDHRKSGVDTNATLNEVEDYIKTNNLTDEFNTWLEGKEKEYGIKEVIFDGFTPSGNRRYVPNTLENVSKIMKKQGRNGATGTAVSFQNFAARLMPSYGTLKDIRSKKGLLTSDREEFDKFREKWSNVFYELGMKCQPDATGTFDDYGLARLSEAAMTSDPQAYLKKEYNVDFSDEDTKRLKEMVKAIKEEHPAMYFETKFERPVRFDEFSAAVVPTTTKKEVKEALKNAGVSIFEYDEKNDADRSRAFNEAINSSDNIRFSLKSMMEKPEGWKQANKKAIHIAEVIERDPKFSLKNLDGTLIKAGTYFSGGGLVEEGLKGIIDPVLAVEYDEKISGVYRNNFGQHIVTADVRDVDPRELVKQIDGEVEYFHASPVCKNYSQAKSNHAELELDKETAVSTAEFINAIKPKVVTIENVKGYKDSDAMKTITEALDANGYTWDADVYNAADYGGYTNRERLIVRAVRDGKLPEKPKKMARKSGWYEAVADIIPTLTEKKNGVAPWMDIRLKADGIDWRNIDKPLYVMGSAYADGKVPHAFADELLPTLRTKSGDVIVMPDGKVYRAMGRVLARVSGVSDDYKMPFSENLSHTIIGNGIPTQLTEHVIAPLLTGSDPKFSIRTYHGTGASFDKFDLSHALEGEGSESFGHGVYVTNSSKIGREYAQRAKNRKMEDLYKNMRYPDGVKGDIFKRRVFGEMVNDVATGGSVASAKDFAKKRVGADANDIQRTLENLKDREKGTEYEQNLKDRLAEYKDALKWIDSIDEDYLTQGNANRYDVDIPDDNGNYLGWNDSQNFPLEKWYRLWEITHHGFNENEYFKDGGARYDIDRIERITQMKLESPENGMQKLPTLKGEELYHALEDFFNRERPSYGAELASRALSEIGFVGIKYPAGLIHGGAKEGDYNYVIFDENNANIVGNTRFSLRYDQFEHDLNQWKKDNNLPKDAQRPTIPQRNAGESAVDFLRRVDEYRKQMALWKTAPTYEQHLLSDDTALGEFNRELQRGSVLKRIAFQDSMLAIRKAQEAIMKEVGVDRLNMAEDAYTAENRSHGKGKNEFEEYNNEFLQPLRKAYHQMKKILGDSYDNVRIYMMAKHGLERDAQMAFKKSLDADFEDVAQRSAAYRAYKGDMNRITNDSDLEFGRVDFTTWRQRDNALRTKYSPSYMDYRYDENGIAYDYSGLSALFGGSDFEEAAHKLVMDIESNHVAEVQDLWNATNAATKKILRDGYKAGMMSKDTYQYVRDMYSHYIPLRGWDGTTADQVWDYIGGGKGAFNQTLKKAHGRTSIADDPIAYIENMAESGILLNNKNWVKQHLMLLAQNHPTSLLTLSKAWYVKSTDANGNEEWIPATPQITYQMDSNQVKAAIDAFEKKMEQMAQTGDATQKRDGLNIAYPQTHSEEREHEVRVMKDGEEYVIYVNGDPQLAQAMNNTRAHRVSEGIKNSISKRVIAVVGRKMAAAYTSLSPLFIPSNYFRDLTMTLASTAIREDAKYNYLLGKNLTTSWNLGFMLKDYQNGKLREKVSNGNATPKEQMFYDFMMNGGETGFVSSLDVEDLKKKFKNDLKDLDRWKANPVKVGHTIMDSIEFLNRMIEDSNRFAVYMTSIQYGRSIDEAVNDAKNVTLNFNRKGTGEHSWQTIRNLYLFINPAVQSLQTLGALAKHHPFKFTAVTASWIASGVLVPIVNAAFMQMAAAFLGGDGDDDKDWYKDISKKYWQFSKWDRRNNFIMWVPTTHEFVKIPLAQEFRAFYGLGDMIASKMMGGELAEESWEDYGWDLVGQVVDMLPLDPTGYDGELGVSLMPNPIRPVFELAFNVDFTGKPLFKDTEYNKYDPNFTKAYVGTPDWLVRASRMMNSIGNDYPDVQQNKWDALGNPRYNLNNPAVVDHVLSSYLGGAYTMGSQVLGLLTKSLNDRKEIKVADIPLVSKFVSNPDDRPVSKKQGDEFWDKKEYYDRASNTISKLKKQAKINGDYSLLERFYGSEEYKQYKQDDVKVKKYEEDKKKERAEESGEEYRPHKLNAEDIYKAHATPKDDFEDLKLKQLYTKLNGFKTSYDLLVDTAPSQSEGYYNTNKAAIDAIDEISLDKQEISELKKGFLDDGKDAYNAEDMKQIRELRKKILAVLEKANKVVVANQKAKTEK
jgi:site-specific DNA-cytosine methylase